MDLFYRLNVVDIHVPSLKEREEDIPLLADHFLDIYRKQMNKNIKYVLISISAIILLFVASIIFIKSTSIGLVSLSLIFIITFFIRLYHKITDIHLLKLTCSQEYF